MSYLLYRFSDFYLILIYIFLITNYKIYESFVLSFLFLFVLSLYLKMLSGYSWICIQQLLLRCSGDHLGYQELNLGNPRATQVFYIISVITLVPSYINLFLYISIYIYICLPFVWILYFSPHFYYREHFFFNLEWHFVYFCFVLLMESDYVMHSFDVVC